MRFCLKLAAMELYWWYHDLVRKKTWFDMLLKPEIQVTVQLLLHKRLLRWVANITCISGHSCRHSPLVIMGEIPLSSSTNKGFKHCSHVAMPYYAIFGGSSHRSQVVFRTLVYNPVIGGITHVGDLLTRITKKLLSGMILQVSYVLLCASWHIGYIFALIPI